MRRKRGRNKPESEVNLTPMLDVVFIMLIFFIVTASFVKEAGIEISRPGASTATRNEKGNILIAITDTNQVWMDRPARTPSKHRAHARGKPQWSCDHPSGYQE